MSAPTGTLRVLVQVDDNPPHPAGEITGDTLNRAALVSLLDEIRDDAGDVLAAAIAGCEDPHCAHAHAPAVGAR